MSDFTAEIAADLVAACTEGSSEIAEALSRALDTTITVEVGEAATVDRENLPETLNDAGLAVVLVIGEVAAVVTLPESTGILPEWYANPDPTGESKLTTLAQELGMLVVPEAFMPEDFKASRVDNLAEAIVRGDIASGAGVITLVLSTEDQSATMSVFWPAAKPHDLLQTPAASEASEPEEEPGAAAQIEPQAEPVTAPEQEARPASLSGSQQHDNATTFDEGVHKLPGYTRSLLRVDVPVSVLLAETRQSVDDVISLGPGSIIQFNKSCDEMLSLEVGGQRIAEGEAVKIGDKFGLRITSMVLPDERFTKVKGRRQG